MAEKRVPLLLVGCGKMGGAMVQGWLDAGYAAKDIVIVEPAGTVGIDGPTVVESGDAVPGGFKPEIVILAVKPQVMDEAAAPYARYAGPGTCFLSIAAGRTIASLQAVLGAEAAVIRAMPNTPSAVGRGVTGVVASGGVSDAQKALATDLLSAVGKVVWVEDENLIDAVTGVSGSGPAYVFHLVECMAAAGVEAGLPEELAMTLARATVEGAGELLYRSEESAEQLRINVTSPKGTTEAALKVLMAEDGLKPLMARAVAAAAKRAGELSG